jgi:hypothetical protein
MKNYVLLFLLLISSVGCSNDETVFNEYSQFIIDDKITTDFEFMPKEVYEEYNKKQTPKLVLEIKTTKIYPCINYTIVASEFIENNELIIRFEKIDKSIICLTAIGPATTYIEIPENITKLVLLNGDLIDEYSVDIDENKIEIASIKSSFTNSLYNKTFRFPKNSFAYICGTNTDNTRIQTEFLNIILNNSSITEFNFDNDGRIPYPIESDGHWVDFPSSFFKYENESDFEDLGQLLNAYSSQNIPPNSGVTISLVGWNNIIHYSWD